MTAERWQRVKEEFERTRGMSAAVCDDYLESLSATDPDLAGELRALLTAHHQSESFLATGAMQEAARDDLAAAGLTLMGLRLGAYRVGPLLGVGGMGEVYRGERDDGMFDQSVAIKVVRCGDDPAAVARFRAERQILASLSHPNIARIFDGGTTAHGEPYLVMEYIHGQRIDEYCSTHALDQAQRLRLIQTVCAAVEHAHQRGILHRDIKPANIMVGEDGAPRLLDFGIAKLLEPSGAPQVTGTLLRACTPDYASPEQLRSQPLTAASDVYSLGAVMWELLTGRRLAAAGDAKASQLPVGLSRVIAKATDADPVERYSSAAGLAAAIEAVLQRRPVGRVVVASAAILVLAVVVAAALVWRSGGRHGSSGPIAVIGIENLSQDASLDWMDRGVSELLTTGLAQNEKLDVISTERVRNLIGRRVKDDARLPPAQVREVAAASGAATFVSGAVLKVGTRLRLDVKVQDTASGKVLFAHRVEGEDAQALFRMADESAGLMAAQLSGSGGRKPDAEAALTSNVEALKAYTDGLRLAQRFLIGKAVASMRQAIALDPKFAMAHYQIAQFRGAWDPKLCRDETQQAMSIADGLALPRSQKLRMRILYLTCSRQFDEAKQTAQTMVDENPRDWEAWADLSVAALLDGDIAKASTAADRSINAGVTVPIAEGAGWFVWAYSGDLTRALDASRRYQATLEPGDVNGYDMYGDTYSMFGRLDEAIEWYRKEDRADKIALSYLHQGKYDLAESELRRDIEKFPANSLARGGRTGFLGDIEVARGRLDRAIPNFVESVRIYGPQLWFGSDVMFKGAQVFLDQGDPQGLLAFTARVANPWRSGLRAVADLQLGKNAEAEVELADLRTSVSQVLGDAAAKQYEQVYRGVAAYYRHKPEEAIAALSGLPFDYRSLTALTLGRAYLERGDLARAEDELKFVVKAQGIWGIPGWYERQNMLALLMAQYYLGALREKQRRAPEAASYYREFLSHFDRSNARLPQIAEARAALRRIGPAAVNHSGTPSSH